MVFCETKISKAFNVVSLQKLAYCKDIVQQHNKNMFWGYGCKLCKTRSWGYGSFVTKACKLERYIQKYDVRSWGDGKLLHNLRRQNQK